MEKEYSLDEAIKMLIKNPTLKFETAEQGDKSILRRDEDILSCISKKGKADMYIYLDSK